VPARELPDASWPGSGAVVHDAVVAAAGAGAAGAGAVPGQHLRGGPAAEIGLDGRRLLGRDGEFRSGDQRSGTGWCGFSAALGLARGVTESSNLSGYGELIDWQMSPAAWLGAACASAGQGLTSADWQEYVGGPSPGQLACTGLSAPTA